MPIKLEGWHRKDYNRQAKEHGAEEEFLVILRKCRQQELPSSRIWLFQDCHKSDKMEAILLQNWEPQVSSVATRMQQ